MILSFRNIICNNFVPNGKMTGFYLLKFLVLKAGTLERAPSLHLSSQQHQPSKLSDSVSCPSRVGLSGLGNGKKNHVQSRKCAINIRSRSSRLNFGNGRFGSRFAKKGYFPF